MAARLGQEGDVVAGGLIAVVPADVEDAAVAQVLDLRVGEILPRGDDGGGGDVEGPAVGVVGDEQDVVHDGGEWVGHIKAGGCRESGRWQKWRRLRQSPAEG